MLRPPFTWEYTQKKNRVEKAVSGWHVFDPLIVATPESSKFLPPIFVPEFAETLHANILAKHKFALVSFVLIFLVFFAALYLMHSPLVYRLAPLIPFVSFHLYFDTYCVHRSKELIQERSLFVHWVFTQKNIFLKFFIAAMVIAGLLQCFYQWKFGTVDELVIKYGMHFASVNPGEWWRAIVGPFIHASPLHWLGNFLFGIIAIGLAGAMGKKSLIGNFLVFSTFSVLAVQFLRLGVHTDAIVGISGGIFGVFGWVIGFSVREREKFPRFFWVTMLSFSVMTVVMSTLMSANGSQTAHVAGLLLGVTFGLIGISCKDEI